MSAKYQFIIDRPTIYKNLPMIYVDFDVSYEPVHSSLIYIYFSLFADSEFAYNIEREEVFICFKILNTVDVISHPYIVTVGKYLNP